MDWTILTGKSPWRFQTKEGTLFLDDKPSHFQTPEPEGDCGPLESLRDSEEVPREQGWKTLRVFGRPGFPVTGKP